MASTSSSEGDSNPLTEFRICEAALVFRPQSPTNLLSTLSGFSREIILSTAGRELGSCFQQSSMRPHISSVRPQEVQAELAAAGRVGRCPLLTLRVTKGSRFGGNS